ncbi:MAG TPA: hypothetical protein VEK07_24670, partial [Polyangiaceae bacterium]|nr:hypothetical protein [Polyangiaceae bacterium]
RTTAPPPPAVNIAAESLFLRSPGGHRAPDEPVPSPSGPPPLPVVGREDPRPGGDGAPNTAIRGESSVPPIEDVDAGWDD